MDMLTITRR